MIRLKVIFVSNRYQKVKIDNTLSNEPKIE